MVVDEPKGSLPTAEEFAAFEAALAEASDAEEAKPRVDRYVDGSLVAWAPQAGSQTAFLQCPIFEALYHGTRGPGKTDALLMSFAQHVGPKRADGRGGHGAAWRGIIFRTSYPQLADIVAKSLRWFTQMFPGARFVHSGSHGMAWHFETGEMLLFRQMRTPDDYWNYHGHEYPFIGWEELTNWSDDRCFKRMLSCCRSSTPGVPRMVRSTTNPYGPGHNWVKDRYRLHGNWWETIVTIGAKDLQGNDEPPRCAIHGHLSENKILLTADPRYAQTIASAAENQAMADAWGRGSWNLLVGGMFSDIWVPQFNALPRFNVPTTWRIDRAFDWGSARPFSVGWYALSDGSDLLLSNGRRMSTVRGDLFRVKEWYGCTGHPNEGLKWLATQVSAGIVEREISWGWRQGSATRVKPGVADSAIFTTENGSCIANDMAKPVRLKDGRVFNGITWVPADKRPGSRKNGWEAMRERIRNAQPEPGLPRERPGLFIIADECPHFLRTILSLVRDEKDLDDIDTDAEDHIADEVRYRVRAAGNQVGQAGTTGHY